MPAHVRASSAKSDFFPFANASDLRHLGFQLVVSFPKLSDFSQAIFDSAREVVPLGLGGAQFVLVPLPDLGGSLRQFGLEARPSVLLVVVVLLLEQAEGFLRAELGNAGSVPHSEAIQYFSALQLAFAQTEGAFDGLGRNGRLSGHRWGTPFRKQENLAKRFREASNLGNLGEYER